MWPQCVNLMCRLHWSFRFDHMLFTIQMLLDKDECINSIIRLQLANSVCTYFKHQPGIRTKVTCCVFKHQHNLNDCKLCRRPCSTFIIKASVSQDRNNISHKPICFMSVLTGSEFPLACHPVHHPQFPGILNVLVVYTGQNAASFHQIRPRLHYVT